jgi:hypothetical protein
MVLGDTRGTTEEGDTYTAGLSLSWDCVAWDSLCRLSHSLVFMVDRQAASNGGFHLRQGMSARKTQRALDISFLMVIGDVSPYQPFFW